MFNVNAGHTLIGGDIGTRGLGELKEEVLTRKLAQEIVNELEAKGENGNLVKVDHADTLNESLNKQVYLCNAANAQMNIIIHFNTTPGGTGTEIFTYQGEYMAEADRVLNNMELLGFKNRGIKAKGLALVNRTNAPTIYIEVCFIDNQYDVDLLNKYGMKEIAKAIVSGVLGSQYSIPSVKEEKKVRNIVVYSNEVDKRAAEYLADYLQCPIISNSTPFDYSQVENVYAVGAGEFTSYTKQTIKGADRYETVKAVLKFIEK